MADVKIVSMKGKKVGMNLNKDTDLPKTNGTAT